MERLCVHPSPPAAHKTMAVQAIMIRDTSAHARGMTKQHLLKILDFSQSTSILYTQSTNYHPVPSLVHFYIGFRLFFYVVYLFSFYRCNISSLFVWCIFISAFTCDHAPLQLPVILITLSNLYLLDRYYYYLCQAMYVSTSCHPVIYSRLMNTQAPFTLGLVTSNQ